MQLNEASQLLCSVRCVLRRQWTSQYRGDAAGFTRGRERDGSCRIPNQYQGVRCVRKCNNTVDAVIDGGFVYSE